MSIVVRWVSSYVSLLLNGLADVSVDAEDAASVDENLGEDVEDGTVNLSWGRKEEGDESHDDAAKQQDISR